MKLISGNSNLPLSEDIAKYLDDVLTDATIKRFADMEIFVEINENIEPGIKLFNVLTPSGADIGAIIFPDPISDGLIQTTTTPEEFILNKE